MTASSVIGNERLVQFYADGISTTIHMSPDLEMFPPHSIMRLIEFFSTRLSVATFWPQS